MRFVKCVGSASQAQTFTVSGSGLTSNIIITPPTGYEVSLDGTTWVSSLTLNQTSGSVSNTTIYIRLTAAVATININLNITVSTTGDSENIDIDGYINNNVTPGVIKSNQTICNGGDANQISSDQSTANNGDGNDTLPFTTDISYIWQQSTDGGTTWSVITGANSSTYNPPAGSITVTTKFRRITVSSNTNNNSTNFSCQSSPSNVVTVTVNPLPTVDFTFTDNQCSGSAIQFNSNVSGAGPSYSYSWNFGGGGGGNTSTNANPSHTFNNSNGNSSQSFNVTLTVTSNGCSATITKVVTIQNPDTSLNSSADSAIFNGFPIFKVCTNDISQIEFINNSTTSSTNSNYLISWGDLTPNYTSTSFTSTIHQYSVGLWTLTYTVTSQNGCSITKIYKVFVGNNPAVGLGNPGNTNICNSTPLTFPITGTQDNPPGTTYTVTFNDGSVPVVFNHPPPTSITHTFLATSCGVTSLGAQNSFSATIVAANPCDVSSNFVVPIRVSTPPVANFTIPQTIICTDTQICFTNSSIGGSAVTSNSCAVPKVVWIITPSSGFTLISGTLGSDNNGSILTNTWNTGTNVICPVFTVPGTYTITMKTGNSCNISQIVKTICVESPLVPQFTLSGTEFCTPGNVSTTNTTNLTATCPGNPTYLWNVTYAAGYCGTTLATPIPNQTTANASYNFTTPGTYSITLTTTNSCGPVTTLPQTVIIKKPPTVAINSIPDICLGATITPTVLVNTCSNLVPSAYSWTATGATPSTSNTATPPTFSYATPGTYTISHSVTNECGTTNASQSFVVNPIPIITGPSSVCAGQTITLTANSAGAATNPWVSSNPSVATVSATGVVSGIAAGTATITFTNSSNCQTTKIITVNPLPTATLSGTTTVCLNDVQPTLTFTGSGGTAPYTFTYNINGGAAQTVTTTTGNSVTVSVPTSTTGTYVYNLTGVQDASSTTCSRLLTASVTVTVRPLPSATISGTTSICQSGTSPVITFTGSGGTA
ncbi:PKD domain-containing protein, partial [Flavobacterium sp.]|uniref:PKD domain-containing protein n=1 Tax=Flavobacterium sp. TaxID=239 RepID=UPI0037BF6F86